MPEQFLVLCGQIVGNMQAGFDVVYDWDGEVHDDRQSAIAAGLKSRGSDDFSIGVIRDGRLASLDWMDEPKDEEPGSLRDIEDQIGWEDPRNTYAVQQEAEDLQQDGSETDFEWLRRLRQHFADATALAEAEARGMRAGIERAAEVAEEDLRSTLAKELGHEPDWFIRAKAIAKAIRALATAALAETEERGTGASERVRHLKRGTEYEVLGEAEAQIANRITCPDGIGNGVLPNSSILREGDRLTVYRGADGKLWCRFPDEFRDGRFVTITPPQPTATATREDGHA